MKIHSLILAMCLLLTLPACMGTFAESDFEKNWAQGAIWRTPSMTAANRNFQKGWAAYEVGDYKVAAEWWNKSAKQGLAVAQYNLGVFHANGLGVLQDKQEAIYWYRKSAEQGYANAQFALGAHYYEGAGVRRNYKKAVEWYSKAAKQGRVEAQYRLGRIYIVGGGDVPRDYKTAAYWYSKAAEQGHAESQYLLGWRYANGEGVPKHDQKAYMWFLLAKTNGNHSAIKQINKLESNLSRAEIAAAQAEAAQMQVKIDKNIANR